MTRKIFVFIAVYLSCLPACSSPPPIATQMPTATAAQIAPILPTPSPTATAAKIAPILPTPSPTATAAQIAPILPPPSPTASPHPTATEPPTATRSSHRFGAPIAEITAARVGEELSVNGQIVDATSFSDGFKFTLDDGTGQITLLTWLEIYDSIVGREGLRVGAFVQITGAINQYEGALEIVPANGSDVVVVRPGNEQAPERQTGSLTSADIGKRVAVKGEVARAITFSTGERVYLDDGSGEILLLLWQNVFERIPDGHAARTAGSRLHAIGRVEEYEGTLEIVPALPSDVIILYQAPAATPRPADALVPIGELHAGRIGEKAAIAGQVTDTASFSKGFKFTLDDGTGRITLLAWHNVYDALEEPTFLNMGATVEVVGEISEYEGELQIEPYAARDIKVITPGASSAPPQDTDQTAKHVGKRITIVGQITRVEDTHSGTRVFVGDDTGEALVYIWHNILSRVPSSQSLSNSGTVVRITGKVQEYRGEFEIVPALPYDVEVLE